MASNPQDFPFGIMDVVELLHLKIRRRQAGSVYVDCPFCGDRRGKMNVNYIKNVWRCNLCDENGGMLALYAKYYNTTSSDAYREICDAMYNGDIPLGCGGKNGAGEVFGSSDGCSGSGDFGEVQQSQRASAQEVHQTFSMLFEMLTLSGAHWAHLKSEKRGLSDREIKKFGFKSTPPYFLCRSLAERLVKRGCTVQGVPGFYLDGKGYWTIRFTSRTSGILIPAVGIDGLIKGAQILLDMPIKDKDDPPDKQGAKYLWLSSSTKNMGTSSGSPVHFVGDPFARTVYVTEGLLKADIAHCLTGRTFAAVAGANNVGQLDPLFALLAQNGTEEIIEAHDMDKFSNKMTDKGSSRIYLTARKHGMGCRRLTWDPNYKGIDDWQLALRKKAQKGKEDGKTDFKQQYLCGQCGMESLEARIGEYSMEDPEGKTLAEHLGLTEEEYILLEQEDGEGFRKALDAQRRLQGFRVYQLDFSGGNRTIPFAFKGIQEMQKAGFSQPPAADYCLAYSGEFYFPAGQTKEERLRGLVSRFNGELPEGYMGRPVSPSDVVELFDGQERAYYYIDPSGFVQVRFSPFLCKKNFSEGK